MASNKLCICVAIAPALGASAQPVELAKFSPDDIAPGDGFGLVAIDGSTVLVGTPADVNGEDSGAAYVFDVADPTNPVQLHKLVPDDGAAGDLFGSPAIKGDLIVVGAPGKDNETGAAYIFDTTTGEQILKLEAADGAAGDRFGGSVAIGDGIVLVGAHLADTAGPNSGAAYLFDAASGRQLDKILPDDLKPTDAFGVTVAISGSRAVVGAHFEGGAGSAYLFDLPTGEQTAKLVPNDGASGDLFGRSVDISGDFVIVGSYRDDDNGPDSGSAYVFDATTGAQLHKLVPEQAQPGDKCGHVVAISGATAIVNAQWDDDNGKDSGSAYLFDALNGRQLAHVLPSDGEAGDYFAGHAAIDGTLAILNAPGDDDAGLDAGAAYAFDTAVCLADFNADGELNVLDFVYFQLAWADQDPSADCDDNAEFSVLDFVCFQRLFQGGCE